LSRDHTKNLFEFSNASALVVINDCHSPQDSDLENIYWQDGKSAETAMKAIANLISNISSDFEKDRDIILSSLGKGSLLLPAIASGLRASDLNVIGYILINSNLPGALDASDENYEFFETLPLMSDWPDAPIYYLWSEDKYSDLAKEAALRGWFVINNTDNKTISEVIDSISF
jgi:hypothetical protein